MAPPKTALTKGGKVRLIAPGGTLITVDPQDVQLHLQEGARFESAREAVGAAERGELEREFGGTAETIRTFGEGALDMIIPGASGFLSDEAGLRAQVNPTARGLGSLTGLGVGLLSGGALGGATGLSLKAGAGLGTKATKLLGGGTAAKLAGGALGGALETGLFTAGQAVTDATLYNKPITAESLASGFLSGVPLGALAGGLGAAIPIAGKALQNRRAAKTSAKLFSGTDDVAKANRAAVKQHFDDMDLAFKNPVQIDAAIGQEISQTRKAFLDSLGSKTASSDDFLKVMNSGDLQKISKMAKAMDDYKGALVKDAGEDLIAKFDDFENRLKIGVEEALGQPGAWDAVADLATAAELADLAGANIIPDEALGPTGSAIFKAAMLLGIGRRIAKGRGQGKGFLGSLFKTAAGAHASGTVFEAAGKAGASYGVRRAAASVAGNVAHRQARAVLDGDILNLLRIQNKAQGRVGRAVTRFGKGVVGKAQVPLTVHKALQGIMTPQEKSEVLQQKDPAKKFLSTMNTLKKLQGDELLTRVAELAAPIEALNPELGGELRKTLIADLQFLQGKMPVNPGNMATFVQDRWLPTPTDMEKFSRYVRALNDPASIIERAAAGRMTPEEAEVLKKRRPAFFQEMQRRLLENPEKLKDMNYGVRVNLGLLFDVQTDPTMGIMDSTQAHFEVLAQQGQVPQGPTPQSPPTGLNEPTKAQQLENR